MRSAARSLTALALSLSYSQNESMLSLYFRTSNIDGAYDYQAEYW